MDDDDYYNFQNMEDSPEYLNPAPITMEEDYPYYDQLKEPAEVLYDYYNNPEILEIQQQPQEEIQIPTGNDPKMIMIQQINNDEEKDWSEEDISDLEEVKNDILPSSNNSHKNFNNNKQSKTKQINANNRRNSNNSTEPHYVNVNDLINTIGFGKFHYQLIFLCGLGYIADSMWGEAISLIITPIQNEFNIDNIYIGWLAATLFTGMCFGSFIWGRTSDIVGRKFPFTLTLTIGGICGMITAFMPSYNWLLISLLCLGFGVGGNIPVDGAILAEFLPTSHRGSIMVSLSIFWALGDLLSSFFGWLIIPNRICHNVDINGCTLEQNMGWRYFIFLLGAINCCFLFFRLGTNESPNFLICQGDGGRKRALAVLKHISEVNECPPNTVTNNMILQVDNPLLNRKLIQKLKYKQKLQQELNRNRLLSPPNNNDRRPSSHYSIPPKSKTNSFESINLSSINGNTNNTNKTKSSSLLQHAAGQSVAQSSARSSSSAINTNTNTNLSFNNINVNIDLDLESHSMSWSDIISELFSNKTHGRNLRLATPIIWIAWFGSSFGLSTFGVFLPKFLSSKDIHISSVYGDALILAIASFPGPFIGAYLVETHRFGRRYTMTISAIFISISIMIFIFVNNEFGLVFLACFISLLTQIFYAGLMCYTPEAYPTDIRTTASGIATGIRHVANILGPIIAGKTFGAHGHTPLVLASLSVFMAGATTYFLPFDTRKKRLVPTVRVSL